MDDITVYVLLEFLYNEFGTTFVLCLIGSLIREAFRTTKDPKSKMLDIKKIATSTVFSTFLMCACAEYIDLPFGVYATISVICGMWGLVLINLALNGKFMSDFLANMLKKFAGPLLKSVVESASEILEEQETPEDKDEDDQQDEK